MCIFPTASIASGGAGSQSPMSSQSPHPTPRRFRIGNSPCPFMFVRLRHRIAPAWTHFPETVPAGCVPRLYPLADMPPHVCVR